MNEQERHELAIRLASTVVRAAQHHPTAVVTNDAEVARVALELHAVVLADPGSLDAAADTGRTWARERGASRTVVLHADLPFIRDIRVLTRPGVARVAILVPDQRNDGTPALSVPTDAEFEFAYGPGSLARHTTNAASIGLAVRLEYDSSLGFDVDLPEDLAVMREKERAQKERTL
jgi:2-phospho-L-lactate guanylyltransferase